MSNDLEKAFGGSQGCYGKSLLVVRVAIVKRKWDETIQKWDCGRGVSMEFRVQINHSSILTKKKNIAIESFNNMREEFIKQIEACTAGVWFADTSTSERWEYTRARGILNLVRT